MSVDQLNKNIEKAIYLLKKNEIFNELSQEDKHDILLSLEISIFNNTFNNA